VVEHFASDPLFTVSDPTVAVRNLLGSTVGARYDIVNLAAFKVEYRRTARNPTNPSSTGSFSKPASPSEESEMRGLINLRIFALLALLGGLGLISGPAAQTTEGPDIAIVVNSEMRKQFEHAGIEKNFPWRAPILELKLPVVLLMDAPGPGNRRHTANCPPDV